MQMSFRVCAFLACSAVVSAEYDAIIAQLDENVARTSGHLDGLLDDYDRVLAHLRDLSEGEISHDVSAVVRALESIGAEALQVIALLDHRGGDHGAARRAVDRLRRLQEITVNGLRPQV
jgi:hypothetical protein